MTEAEQRAAVIAEAESWIGTKFEIGQSLKGGAVDCGRFLVSSFAAAGVPVPDPATFPFFPVDWHLHTQDERYLEIIEPFAPRVMDTSDDPQPGDIVMFRMTKHRPAPWSHSAVVIAWPRLVHAHWRSGVGYANAEKHPLAKLPMLWLSPWVK